MSNSISSQRETLLRHLRSRGAITPLDALNEYGIMRLGARIYELKRDGYFIESKMRYLPNGKRVAQYQFRPGCEHARLVQTGTA